MYTIPRMNLVLPECNGYTLAAKNARAAKAMEHVKDPEDLPGVES